MNISEISPDFNFESKYIDIAGSKIHYIDVGSGDPILFLHGNPTSSYLWRNIIPHVASSGRCIAMDLIGMGKSDKPDISYRFVDHARYVEEFIDKMRLKNITLVIHDWGSALGFHYAMRHQDNIKGIAFMEAILRPARWSEFPKDMKIAFKLFRTQFIGWIMIAGMNIFIEKVLPKSVVRKLTEEEMTHYREPFKRIRDRKPVRQWPCEIPIDGKPADVMEIVQTYSDKLKESDCPKLLLFAHPGAITAEPMVMWCRQNLKKLKTVDIGEGRHFLQEDNPRLIGMELSSWYRSL